MRSTAPRCVGSAISNVKRDNAIRSRVVWTDADRMLTCWSDSARVTSDSSRARSSASTWIWTRNSVVDDGAHSTSTMRSGCSSREATFAQSARCTDTPLPRVTKPRIGSPGTGVQHFASLTQTSSTPRTTTPGSPCVRAERLRASLLGCTASAMSSVAPSVPPSESTSRWTTDAR